MRNTFAIYVAALMACFALPAPLTAQEVLTLQIQVDKEQFDLGEPVVLYVTLRNAGSQAVEVLHFLEPEFGYAEYLITGPDGEELKFRPSALVDHPEPYQLLAPGEEIQGEAKIFFGGAGWTFANPGTYNVRAAYLGTGGVVSNTITISVLQPTSAAARAAAQQFINSEEVGYFLLFEGGDHLTEGMQRLELVAQNYSQTPHAAYANYALGNNLLQDFANFRTNSMRAADPQRAIAYLERAQLSTVSLYQTMHTHLSLARGYTLIGNSERATAVRGQLNNLISVRYPAFRRLADEIIQRRGIIINN